MSYFQNEVLFVLKKAKKSISSISIKEVIITSILIKFDQKNQFF